MIYVKEKCMETRMGYDREIPSLKVVILILFYTLMRITALAC